MAIVTIIIAALALIVGMVCIIITGKRIDALGKRIDNLPKAQPASNTTVTVKTDTDYLRFDANGNAIFEGDVVCGGISIKE